VAGWGRSMAMQEHRTWAVGHARPPITHRLKNLSSSIDERQTCDRHREGCQDASGDAHGTARLCLVHHLHTGGVRGVRTRGACVRARLICRRLRGLRSSGRWKRRGDNCS
jgi:hypothetical protein